MMRANLSNIHVLRIPLPFRLREVNLHLLRDHAGYTLIDTGPNTLQAVAALESELADLGVSWESIHTILITHYHSDHCGLAAEVRRRSGANIYMDRQDWELLRIFFAHPEKIIGPEEFYLREGMPRELVSGLDRSVRPLMDLILPFTPDRFYGEQEPIVSSPFTLVPVRTPGHTVGHTCFYEGGRGLFFCGDHVLDRITPNIAAHPLNPLADPLHAYLDSLALLRDLSVSATLAAHGPPIGDLIGRIDAIREHHALRMANIRKILEQSPATAYTISLQIFGDDLDALERWMAFYETLAHLVHLENGGQIQSGENGERHWYTLV